MRYFSLLSTRKIISGWKKALFLKRLLVILRNPSAFPGERSSPRCCQSDRDQQPRRGAHRDFPTNAAKENCQKKQGSFKINKLKDIWGIKINPFEK